MNLNQPADMDDWISDEEEAGEGDDTSSSTTYAPLLQRQDQEIMELNSKVTLKEI